MKNFFNLFKKAVKVESVKVEPIVTNQDLVDAIKLARTVWPDAPIYINLEIWDYRPGDTISSGFTLYVESIIHSNKFVTLRAMLTFIRNYK